MSRMLKSRDNLKKCILFVLLLGFISIGAIGGCSNSEVGGQGSAGDTQALTENDFANDPSLRADPETNIVATFLEHPNSDTPENDTGQTGNDTIPYKYTRILEYTFCWEDEDDEAGHFMELKDGEGNEVLRVDVNGECVSEVIEAGNYVMIIHHDGRIETSHPIFIIPNPEELEQTRETDGLVNRFKVVAPNIIKGVQSTVTKDAEAQVDQNNINTLIKSNSCEGCDLSDADLSGADLSGADLNDAKLNYANLTGADLTGADLSSANCPGAIFTEADLTGADLTGAVLIAADLSGATLTGADLTGADLTGADLDFTVWCNGCTCAVGSVGTCTGCPPVEEVCTGS